MNEVINVVAGLAIIVAVLGCIPYGIWMIYTAVKKRWKKLLLQAVIPATVFLVLGLLSSLTRSAAIEQDLRGFYDAEVELGKPLFEYDSPRAFNGDGYSFSVYELPASVRTRFESVDEKLLTQFPEKPDYRSAWSAEPWREAPFDEKFGRCLQFALSRYDARNAPSLSEHFDAIRQALERSGTYYSFFYTGDTEHQGNIDFFVVDLVGGRLYSINHNT